MGVCYDFQTEAGDIAGSGVSPLNRSLSDNPLITPILAFPLRGGRDITDRRITTDERSRGGGAHPEDGGGGVDLLLPVQRAYRVVAREGIRPIMFRQERGAVMAADGYSRMSNRERFGVIITQGGPGSENSMGGLAQAYADNVPVLYLPGGPAVSQYSVQPNFSPARTYESVSTHSEVLLKADQVANVMRRAFHALRNGRPGPVIVEIPADIGPQEVPESAMAYQPPKRSPQAPSQADVRDAVKLLLGAKKPVIWSGMGVLLSGASDELRELAELAEVPVYCTMPGKSGFDERHPLSLGSGSGATGLHARTWLQESDVLMALGSSMTRTSYGQPIPDGKVIIHNTESIEDINKDYTVDVGLPGDAGLTIRMLIDEVKAQAGEKRAARPDGGSRTR